MAKHNDNQSSASNTPLLLLVGLGIPFVFLVFVVYFFGLGAQSALKPVQLATGEWAPYTGEDIPSNGIATAIVSEVMRDLGYEPHYQFMSWPVAEERAAQSKTDDEIRGTFPYLKSDDRERRFYYTDPIMTYELTAFYNAHTNPQAAGIKTAEDLAAFPILQIAGYDYPAEIKRHLKPGAKVVRDLKAAFEAIAGSDESYIVIESVVVGNQLLEQKLPDLVPTISAAPYRAMAGLHLILSMKNPNNRTLRDDFNRSLTGLKQNADAFKAFQQTVQQQIDLARAVQLEPYDKDGIVRAYINREKTKSILLPRGSRAIVKQWDPQYLQGLPVSKQSLQTLVRIQLLNGPMKNREFFVDGRAVNLP